MFYVAIVLLEYDKHTLERYILFYLHSSVPLISFSDSYLNYAQIPPIQLDPLPENIHLQTLTDMSTYTQLPGND